MASRPTNALPVLYNELIPISRHDHKNWRFRLQDKLPFMSEIHAIPLAVEEFGMAQRNFPIVFSSGPNPVPLALMGLNDGVNVFFDEEGNCRESHIYLPAYIRRYPFMLAKIDPKSEDMSLCVDPSRGMVGEFEDGEPLFEGDEPSEFTKNILGFCEQFAISAQRTNDFVAELMEHKLLIDGEVAIQPNDASTPYVYRSFQIVSEERLKELRGDVLRKMVKSGLLPLVYAHLMSLSLVQDIFQRQAILGRIPPLPENEQNPSA